MKVFMTASGPFNGERVCIQRLHTMNLFSRDNNVFFVVFGGHNYYDCVRSALRPDKQYTRIPIADSLTAKHNPSDRILPGSL